MGLRGGRSATTISDSERARTLGRAGRAKQLAAKQAAQRTAQQAAARPPANPPTTSPHLNPAAAVAGAQANALHGFFELLPVAASLRIHRLRPVWAAGYLEDTDKATIATYGGIHSYLLNTWGGDAYRVELIDEVGRPLGPGWTIAIRGPVRDRGAVEDTPQPVRSAPQVLPPREYAPPPAYAPPAPPAPAYGTQINPAQSAALVDLVKSLGQTNAALLEELQHVRAGNGNGNGGSHAADPGSVFVQAKRTLAQVRDFERMIDAYGGDRGPRAAEPDPDDGYGVRPGPVKDVMRSLAQAIGESLADDIRGKRERTAGGRAAPPPRAARPQPPPDAGDGDGDGADEVIDAQVVQ